MIDTKIVRAAADRAEKWSKSPAGLRNTPQEYALFDSAKSLRQCAYEIDALHAAYSHSQQQFLDGEKERDTLRSQLPDDMQNCTIVLERCDVGHGQLTATNWVKHPCPYCKIDTLRELVREAQTYIEPTSPWRRVWNERAEKALEQL